MVPASLLIEGKVKLDPERLPDRVSIFDKRAARILTGSDPSILTSYDIVKEVAEE